MLPNPPHVEERISSLGSSWAGYMPNTNLLENELSLGRDMNSSIISSFHAQRQPWLVYVLPLSIIPVFKDGQPRFNKKS